MEDEDESDSDDDTEDESEREQEEEEDDDDDDDIVPSITLLPYEDAVPIPKEDANNQANTKGAHGYKNMIHQIATLSSLSCLFIYQIHFMFKYFSLVITFDSFD